MFDQLRFEKALSQYKKDFVPTHWQNEKYKWEAVKWFQDNWDIEADDFADMLDRALAKTNNLLASQNNFPRDMILGFAKDAPEEVRTMFRDLYDESRNVVERIESFKNQAEILRTKYEKQAKQHFQLENAISTYLWLRFPDKYYIYKFSEAKAVADELESDYPFKKGDYTTNLQNFFQFYNELCDKLKQDTELVSMFRKQLTDACYPDPELKTLTFDFGFYISRDYKKTEPKEKPSSKEKDTYTAKSHGYWWLTANPKIWSFSNLEKDGIQAYTLKNENGHKRRMPQNFEAVKEGDLVIGYEANPVKQVVALGRISAASDGEKICFQKTEGLSNPIDYKTLKECPELEGMEFFRNPNGTLFKLKEDEYECIMDMIREENPIPTDVDKPASYKPSDFLSDVYMSEDQYNRLVGVLHYKKNIILQGAPGVGKTFCARRLAWSLMREKDNNRIELVQFHQNYSYEDFMLGYKPSGEGFELQYGVFYRFCQKAANQPDKEFFFIIDEINRGNLSKIFGELLMLIEKEYRGTKVTLGYNGLPFAVPKNLYIIGMMNTADRSLALIDYALRRRFSFFEMEPAFESDGFKAYQAWLGNPMFDALIAEIQKLNEEIRQDRSLGKGFCIGHSYFCGRTKENCTKEWMQLVVDYDILPMLAEYWFDEESKVQNWEKDLHGVLQ